MVNLREEKGVNQIKGAIKLFLFNYEMQFCWDSRKSLVISNHDNE